MIEVNTRGSSAYRHQFTISGSKTTISFASMFSEGSASSGSVAEFFSDSGNDGILSRLYEQMTGQTIGPRSNVAATDTASEEIPLKIPMLSRGEAVDTSRGFNTASKGDHKLSADEIETLRGRYDLENLSLQDRYDLLCDLTDLGVLTASDAESAGRLAVVKTEGYSISYTIVYIEDDGEGKDTLLKHLTRMLKREREDSAAIAGLIGKPGGDRYRITAERLEASIEHHERVYSAIESLSPVQ